MELLAKRLNYAISELDKLISVNSGGCCYLAYRIAYWLEKYQIEYQFVIQDDIPICNKTGKHYCLQVLSETTKSFYINKDANKYPFIKTISLNSTQILEKYKSTKWSEKYNQEDNKIIDELVDSIFEIPSISLLNLFNGYFRI